jgi:uncharacterized membrane protein YgdD (TMEM256/DUF423 family)
MDRLFLMFAGAFGFLGVALGAFGAHALEEALEPRSREVFETAVRYQMYHALALGLVGLLVARAPSGPTLAAGWAFTAGILLFSGSLFLLSLTGTRWLGAVAPIGGTAFLVGWALLAWAALYGPPPGP